MMALPFNSLSQRRYPITKINKGDTLVIMKLSQARDINSKFAKLKLYIDSLNKVHNVKVEELTKASDSLLIQNTELQVVVEKSSLKVDKLQIAIKELSSKKSLICGISSDYDTIYYYDLNQAKKYKLRDFNTWSIQPNIGFTYGTFDRIDNDLFETSISSNFDLGLKLNKQLSPFISTNLNLYKTKFTGTGKNLLYNTKVNWYVDIAPQFQIGNIRLLDNYKNTLFYFSTGLGVINFKTNVTAPQKEYTIEKTDLVIPFYVGTRYKISNKSSINLEFNYNYYLGDDLDGYAQLYSDNDTYYRVSLGFVYQLGRKSKQSLTWYNPFNVKYDDIFEKKAISLN